MILGIYNTVKALIILVCYAAFAILDPVEVLTIIRLGEKENDKIWKVRDPQPIIHDEMQDH